MLPKIQRRFVCALGTAGLLAAGSAFRDDLLSRLEQTTSFEQYIKRVYEDLDAQHGIAACAELSDEEEDLIDASGGHRAYGEVTFDGVNMLMEMADMTEESVFFDLGSGLGKMTLQVSSYLVFVHTLGMAALAATSFCWDRAGKRETRCCLRGPQSSMPHAA